LPSRATAQSLPDWLALPFPYALVSDAGIIENQGTSPLPTLSATISKVPCVLLLDSSDVTLLSIKVPPLSAARMKAALPGLVEEQLLCDPAECVIVAGALCDGLRTIAVIQRHWLELVYKTFTSLGARHIAALPAQLCLAPQAAQSAPHSVTAAINQWNGDIGITLRLPEQAGIGIRLGPVASQTEGANPMETVASFALRCLCLLVPALPIKLYVPQAELGAFQETLDETVELAARISLITDDWSHWISGTKGITLNLMAGLSAGTGPKLEWYPWRWPIALAAVLLLVNVIALNIDWWRMKREANVLRSTMIQIYKSAYPKESVIIDPVAQMQQKIAMAKRDSGMAAPDDFAALTAVFGEAWAGVAATAGKSTAAISALEYHDRNLLVRFKPEGEAPMQAIKTELAKRNLVLELKPEQAGVAVWLIRSAK
jgi:general secretion pathway protein L